MPGTPASDCTSPYAMLAASALTPVSSAEPRDHCQLRPMKARFGTGEMPCRSTKAPCAREYRDGDECRRDQIDGAAERGHQRLPATN
jgi:hypothetical protein